MLKGMFLHFYRTSKEVLYKPGVVCHLQRTNTSHRAVSMTQGLAMRQILGV